MSLPEEVVQIPITKLRAFPEHPFSASVIMFLNLTSLSASGGIS